MFFGGRYVVLLMGCFSMYCVFFYNEIYSKAWNIVGIGWEIPGWDSVNDRSSIYNVTYVACI